MSCKNCALAREALMRAKIKEAAGYVAKAVKEAVKTVTETKPAAKTATKE